MLRTLGHCFLLLLFIGVSCFGLLYGRPLSNDKQSYNDTNIELGGPNNLNMINYLTQGVSLSQFRKMSKNATSFRDIYRIFLHDKQTSDDEIDKMLTTRPFRGLFKHAREDDYDDYFETEKWPGEDYDFNTDIKNVADEAYEHYLAVKDHPLGRCYEPTPELRHIPPEGNKLYFPEYTILHVCRNVSGCCWNPMQECAEKDIEIVSKSFIVTEIQHTDHGDEVYVPEANKVEVKLFKNVTRCGCIELNPLPRCEKKCPFPFIMERPGTECICDCKDDTLSCLKIKYGIEPLSGQSFSCVKSGNCMKPQCESGGFDMRKGYCPGMNDARWKLHNRDKRNANFLSQQKSKLIVKQRKSKLNDKLHSNR